MTLTIAAGRISTIGESPLGGNSGPAVPMPGRSASGLRPDRITRLPSERHGRAAWPNGMDFATHGRYSAG